VYTNRMSRTMMPEDPEQLLAFMRGETNDPGWVRAVRGGIRFPVPGEVNMNNTKWYEDMAAALKGRDHAIKMVNRWQQQLADAEHEVARLSSMQGNEAQVPEPAAVMYEPIEQV
jgi:hypothetical protein